MTVNEAVSAAADGKNAVLETTAGDIELNDAVTAGQNVTVNAKAGVAQNVDGEKKGNVTATAGDVYVEAQGGDVAMADGTTTEATAGNVRVIASGNVNLSSVKAENGDVSVVATAGDITDNLTDGETADAEKANVTAKKLRLEAGKAIGGAAAADIDTSVGNVELVARDGDAFLQNDKAVEIGNVGAVTAKKVLVADATTIDVTDNNLTGAKAESADTGDIRIEADGNLTVSEAVATTARPTGDSTGNIRLESTGGALAVNAAVSGNNVTLASNGKTEVSAGNKVDAAKDLYVKAGGNIALNATDGDKAEARETMALITDNGAIDAKALKTSVLYTQSKNGTTLKGAEVTKQAKGDSDGDIDAEFVGDATVAYNAGGHVKASATGKLTVDSAEGTDGSIKVTEVMKIDEVTAANNGVQEVDLVAADGGADSVEGVTAGTYAALQGTEVTVNKAVAANGGNAVLESTTGAVNLNKSVTASQNVTVNAKTAVNQNAGGDITATAGDVYVEAQGGDVAMADGTTTKAGRNARVAASGNVKLSSVKAENGDVSVKAGDGIEDITTAEAANVTAKNLRLEAGKAIGGATAKNIDTSVDNVEFVASDGDAFVHNAKGVTIGNVGNVTVQKTTFAAPTTMAGVTDNNLEGAKATTGNLSVLADGTMKVSEAVSAEAEGKNVVLEAANDPDGNAGDVVATATVTAGQHATVVAAGAVDQNADIKAKGGDAWVEAKGGSVTMKDGTTTEAKNKAYVAATGDTGDVELSLVKTTAADGVASVYSKNGSIKDNLTGETADTEKANIVAQKVRLEAGGGIGEVKNVVNNKNAGDIETTADNLEIKAGTDAFVHNTKAVTIGNVGVVKVNKVATETAVAAETGAGDNLTGAEAGNLSVLADDKMTVKETVNAGNNAVLETTAGDIVLNAAMTAGQNATVIATAGVQQNANVTATAGDAYVQAQGGDVKMKDGTTTEATKGYARVAASGDVKLSAVNAGQTASIKAGGSITDNTKGEDANVTAKKLRLEAGKAIGGAKAKDIDTSVGKAELVAKDGEAFLHNDKALEIGNVGDVKVRKVKADNAETTDVTDKNLTGAKATTGNLSILADGKMTVSEDVTAAAAGKNVVLETSDGDIRIDAKVTAGQNATVNAKGGVTQNADIKAKAGDAYVQAQGGNVTMKDGTTTEATKGNARVEADGNVKLSSVKAKNGNASIKAGGSITDNTKDPKDEDANVTAKNLRLEAGKAIGGKGEGDIETSVDKIELKAKNNAYVHNAKALEIGDVGDVTVKKVTADTAKTTGVTDEDLTGAESTAGDIRIVAKGDLTGTEAVNAKDIRLESESEKGAVTLNDTVTAEKNLTIASKGKTTANAALEAKAGDLYVKSSDGAVELAEMVKAGEDMLVEAKGAIDVKAGATVRNGTAAFISDDKITADKVNAKVLYSKDVNGSKFNDTTANKRVAETKSDYTESFTQDVTLGVNAGGDVNVTVNGTLTVGASSGGFGAATITEVEATGETRDKQVSAPGGGASASGIHAGKNADIDAKAIGGNEISAGGNATINATAGDYGVKKTKAGGLLDLDVKGSVKDAEEISAGTIEADVTGSLNADTVSASGDAKLVVGNDATISELSAGQLTADIGGNLESATVEVKGDATLTVGGNVTVTDFSAAKLTANIDKDLVSEKTFAVADDADLTVGKKGGNATFNELTAGNLTATVGGDVQATTIAVNKDANFKEVKGDFTFDQFTAGNVTANVGGNVAMGHLNAGNVEIHAGSISDNGSLVEANTLTMTAGGDIGSPSKEIAFKAGTINQISGNNVYLEDVSPRGSTVRLGLIEAKGDLNLTAANIGMANGKGGYIDANGDGDDPRSGINLSSGGNMRLDVAGYMGTASDQLEIFVGGRLTVDSGELHGRSGKGDDGTPIWYQYILLDGTEKNTDWWNGYRGQNAIPGLVIYRNRVLDGSPELWLRINRAQDFTVETPELKSRQGVFGSPLFIHTDMDVSEAASIGTVDNVNIANASMETLADKNVRNKFFFTDKNALDYLESNASNPSRQDKLYTKEFNSEK